MAYLPHTPPIPTMGDWLDDAPPDSLGAPYTPEGPLCVRCMREADAQDPVTSACPHDPRATSGPIGMYHCPECSAMVLAGHHHGPLCRDCAVLLVA
jgi:hypothetical protein